MGPPEHPHNHPEPEGDVLRHLLRWNLWVQIPLNPTAWAEALIVQAIANLTEGQHALLGPHRGHVLWIRDQLRVYNAVQPNTATLENIWITGDNIFTDAGEQFLLGDNHGVPEQSRVIGFNTRTLLLLLRGASNWLVDFTLAVAPNGFANLWVVNAQISVQTLPLAFLLKSVAPKRITSSSWV